MTPVDAVDPTVLAALSPVDYGVLLLYLGAMLAVGFYFSGRQQNAGEFLLGCHSLDWFPLGMSLAATLVSAGALVGLPGKAYERGLVCWLIPAALWIILPLVVGLVIPIVRGLQLSSVYEYLELRFDARVRRAAALVFLAWRLLWMVALIGLPARALAIAGGWTAMGDWWLVCVLGLVATLYTALGGMRAVAWTDVIQGFVMLLGVLAVIVGVWMQLDGGPARVAEIAEGLGRTQVARMELDWRDEWSLWSALPYWLLAGLSLLVADQVTCQRLLAAKSVNAARTAYVAGALGLSLLLLGLLYAGLCLLAFYYDHPQALRPEWVVNVDGVTRESTIDAAGRPLLDEGNPAHEVRWENIDRLVAQRRILQPNNKEPFTSAEELIDPETNRVLVERLAMRRPPTSKLGGEWIVRRRAPQQMLPQFAADHLPWGAAGLVVAALMAAAMSSFDSGLHSIATLLVVDFHRRGGWGRAWLARRLRKQQAELAEADEIHLARPLLVVLGLAAMVLAIGVSQLAGSLGPLVSVAAALPAPLLAVFLLGMLTRRTTATAALSALVLGVVFTLCLAIFDASAGVWPMIAGTAFTCSAGYALSFAIGKPKSKLDLRGLVAGCGTLGMRAIDEVTPLIAVPEEVESRWR